MSKNSISVLAQTGSDYTHDADIIMQRLGKEFRCLHTRDEFEYLVQKINRRVNENYIEHSDEILLKDIRAAGWSVDSSRYTDADADFCCRESLDDFQKEIRGQFTDAAEAELKNQVKRLQSAIRLILAKDCVQESIRNNQRLKKLNDVIKKETKQWIKDCVVEQICTYSVRPVFLDKKGEPVIVNRHDVILRLFSLLFYIAQKNLNNVKSFWNLTTIFSCTPDAFAASEDL